MKVECDCTNNKIVVQLIITYEQVLWGALAAVWQKERQLATSLEFDYLHQKNQCKMLTGRMTLAMMSLPSALTCFSFFVYIRAHFSFALIGRNLTAQPP